MEAQSEQMIKIAAKDAVVAYQDHVALRIDSLDLSAKVMAVIGHNGAGKSTFIKALLELLPIKSGSLGVYCGQTFSQHMRPDQHMAFCPETGSVFADISVESYVKLWCRLKRADGKFYLHGGQKYIDALYLAPLLPKLGRELSKGQRRRVQTAIGFLSDPKLFLFDEPFDGLDVQKTRELARLISEESAQRAFVVSSHRMDVIERISDQVLVLKEGTLVATGSALEVCRELCPATFRIVGASSLLISQLALRFPGASITEVGDGLEIIGDRTLAEALMPVLQELNAPYASCSPVVPSLVDAMNYHLSLVEENRLRVA